MHLHELLCNLALSGISDGVTQILHSFEQLAYAHLAQ